FRVEMRRVILLQDAREAINRTERRAQVMRDGIGKRLQLLVGGSELQGPQSDALFEFLVQLSDFFFDPFALSDVAIHCDNSCRFTPAVFVKRDGRQDWHLCSITARVKHFARPISLVDDLRRYRLARLAPEVGVEDIL